MAADPPHPRAGCSRRLLLQRAGCGALGALGVIARNATAQSKVSKQVVAYQDHPDGSKRCDRCAQFEPPNACKMVQGPVSPEGSCRLFVLMRQQTSAPAH